MDLLPAEAQQRWVLRRTALLLGFGAEPVRGLVAPTGEFFPDVFDGSPKAVAALLARVQDHAGLGDLRTELSLVTPEGESTKVSACGSGGCGGGGGGAIEVRSDRVVGHDDGSYTVTVGAGEIGNATVLTTALVRAVAYMFLRESGALAELPRAEIEPAVDLAATLLGFGVLVANGSYVFLKGCGGAKVHSATRMPVDEAALSLAVFCKLHGVAPRSASKHLDTTPSEAFDEAVSWTESNAGVLRLLRTDPDVVAADEFSLSQGGGLLGKIFGKRKAKAKQVTSDDLAELERSLRETATAKSEKKVDPAKQKRLAELRELVDETLER